MYDELVAANRFDDIDPGLIKEFGEPKKPESVPEPIPELIPEPEKVSPKKATIKRRKK